MAKKKHQTFYFKTIAELHAIPADKVDNFCRDLALWLMVHRIAEAHSDENVKIKGTSPDVFGWIDDGRHDVKVSINLKS
jgi:hypothetical protein